jgi:hypothetical protein
VPRYGRIDHDYGVALATRAPEDDGPIYMLNLMAYREQADYGETGEPTISGREADDRYAPTDVLAEIGAAVVFFGDVEAGSEPWDRVAVVRYPSRRSFIEMQSRKDFQDKHVHKEAGMARTIVMGTLPRGPMPDDDAKRVLVEVWSDASATDGDGATFDVEGTIIGDGRAWRAARFTPADGTELPATNDGHQAIVVRARINRWS